MKLRDRESLPVLGGFLGVTALLAAVVLALVSQFTAEPIKAAKERDRQQVFHRLGLPDFDRAGEESVCGEFVFFPLFKGDRLIGCVGQGSGKGYGGTMEVLTGFDNQGVITGVQVLRHKETPGLGANVCDRKFQRTIFNLTEKAPDIPANTMLDQYAGKKAADSGNWKITKDGGSFAYLTGATVTSRAIVEVVDGISAAFPLWQRTRLKEMGK